MKHLALTMLCNLFCVFPQIIASSGEYFENKSFQGAQSTKTIDRILPLDAWIHIMKYLPGNDKGLNYLSRIIGVSEEVAKNVIKEFIESVNEVDIDFNNTTDQYFDTLADRIFEHYFSTFSFRCLSSLYNSKFKLSNEYKSNCNKLFGQIIGKFIKQVALDLARRGNSQYESDIYFIKYNDLIYVNNDDLKKILFCRKYLEFLESKYSFDDLKHICQEVDKSSNNLSLGEDVGFGTIVISPEEGTYRLTLGFGAFLLSTLPSVIFGAYYVYYGGKLLSIPTFVAVLMVFCGRYVNAKLDLFDDSEKRRKLCIGEFQKELLKIDHILNEYKS